MKTELEAQGFDNCKPIPIADGGGIAVGCTKCAAICINGVPCHEKGCPNETFECRGCSASVPRRGMYCADCT